jgi:hypothetical protein
MFSACSSSPRRTSHESAAVPCPGPGKPHAARMCAGSQPLYWGTSEDGLLMWSTNPAKLDGCCNPSASPFPAGKSAAAAALLLSFSSGLLLASAAECASSSCCSLYMLLLCPAAVHACRLCSLSLVERLKCQLMLLHLLWLSQGPCTPAGAIRWRCAPARRAG